MAGFLWLRVKLLETLHVKTCGFCVDFMELRRERVLVWLFG